MEDEIKSVIEAMFESLGKEEEYYSYESMIMLDHKETMQAFFEGLIVNVEGSCCSVDKASFITNRCIKALTEKKDFSLQETYKEYHDRGGDLGGLKLEENGDKTCYWCPKIFKTTKEAIHLYKLYINFALEPFYKELKELTNGARKGN